MMSGGDHGYDVRGGRSTSGRLVMLIVALLIFLQVGTMLWTLTRNTSSSCDITRQQHQHDGSTSTTRISFQTRIVQQEPREGNDEERIVSSACARVMDKFHRVNEAYRQGDATATLPVINYALYPGQGFGRLVDHSIFHGLMALALNRPVALYLADRDPYYTWRSFIATGTYDWEMRGPLLEYQDEIQKAFGLLQSDKSSEWTIEAAKKFHDRQQNDFFANKANNATTTTTADLFNSHLPCLHLLHRPTRWPEKSLAKLFWNRIQPWHAATNNTANDSLTTTTMMTKSRHESSFVSPDAAILSPNWGSVWFPSLSMPGIIEGCPLDRLNAKCNVCSYTSNTSFTPAAVSKGVACFKRKSTFVLWIHSHSNIYAQNGQSRRNQNAKTVHDTSFLFTACFTTIAAVGGAKKYQRLVDPFG
jgi:hypothetical protein